MDIFIVLLLIAGAVLFWYQSLKAREQAEQAAKHLCHKLAVQFLDHSVALSSLKPTRLSNGRIALKRIYNFEFSQQGAERSQGRIVMTGHSINNIQVDHDEGTTIEQ